MLNLDLSKLSSQIDRYKSFEDVNGGSGVSQLDVNAKKALYKNTSDKSITSARAAFVQYLARHSFPKGVSFHEELAKPVTTEKFLGKRGVDLYKAALKEEMNSRSYRDAVFNQATKFKEGPRLAKRPIIIIAGPSACGKSYATDRVIDKLAEMPKKNNGEEGNYIACVDNAIGREVSQMRKLLLRVANRQGFSGIKDLHSNSKALEQAKKYVQNAADTDSKFGMAIPDTFAKWGIKPGLASARKKFFRDNMQGDRQVIFSRVAGDPNTDFKSAVDFMGNSRAWKKGHFTLPLPSIADFNLNDAKDLAESKSYGASGFFFGIRGSDKAFEAYKEMAGESALTLTLKNDLILLKQTNERPEKWERASSSDANAKLFSLSVFNKWKGDYALQWLEDRSYVNACSSKFGLNAYAAKNKIPLICSEAMKIQCAHPHIMPTPVINMTQFQQQACMKQLTERATNFALGHREHLLYDPQGRFLIDLSLTDIERASFKKAFGKEPSKIITLSLDVSEIPQLRNDFKKKYMLTEAQLKQLSAIKGSIIPLQQEFHFHLALTARTYAKLRNNTVSEQQIFKARQHALVAINKRVINEFTGALLRATKAGKLDDRKLIQQLDKARKTLYSKAHHIFCAEIAKIPGEKLTSHMAIVSKNDLKHLAEMTTATGHDLLHTDTGLGLATWISGSNVNALNRGEGEKHLADRQIVNISLDDKKSTRQRLQIRTSSLDIKKGIPNDQMVRNICHKLNILKHNYSMGKVIPKNALGTQAFTYNLYITLNDTFGAQKGNKQSQGARNIFAGAHQYNAMQLTSNPPVFCFVQNISVNGFGSRLGFKGNALSREATLMSNMALIHNLMPIDSDKKMESKIKEIFDKYRGYLHRSPRESFFSKSEEGKTAGKAIKFVQDFWAKKDNRSDVSQQDTFTQAKGALKAMMAHNLHHKHSYAKLFQTLSVFVEDASISGCKSGNERAQMINGRVAVLDSVMQRPDSAIAKIITALAHADSKSIKVVSKQLKKALDKEYDLHLQSAASLITLDDQGASAKVQAKPGIASRIYQKIRAVFDRNYAEESSLRLLHQENAGSMQAHKGLSATIIDAARHTSASSLIPSPQSDARVKHEKADACEVMKNQGHMEIQEALRKAIYQISNTEHVTPLKYMLRASSELTKSVEKESMLKVHGALKSAHDHLKEYHTPQDVGITKLLKDIIKQIHNEHILTPSVCNQQAANCQDVNLKNAEEEGESRVKEL